jgi:uncharacterized protein YybS (DUF2232 family)
VALTDAAVLAVALALALALAVTDATALTLATADVTVAFAGGMTTVSVGGGVTIATAVLADVAFTLCGAGVCSGLSQANVKRTKTLKRVAHVAAIFFTSGSCRGFGFHARCLRLG